MSFEHPEFFLLVMIVPLMIAGGILTARGQGRLWKRLVAERLRPILVHERPQALRWVSFGVFLLGFALLIAALANPIGGYREAPETIRGRNILLAVDVSRSMLATDESPSRLAAARVAALELLDRFPSDRIGIIAFSGVAWLQAPLTVDHDALRETFQQLEFQDRSSEWIPRSGSDLSTAVDLAIKTFKETGQRNNALIILSDGETHAGGLEEAAEDADEAGLTIFTAGFGTDEGSFIPDPASRDGKLHDRNGNLVLSRLNSDALSLLARRTGGFYTAGSGRHFSDNLEVAVARLDQFELEGLKRRIAIPLFQWFLVPSIVLFVVGMLLNTSWRRAATPAVGLLAALAVWALQAPSEAGLIPRTKAEEAYGKGDHQRALELFGQEVAGAQGNRRARLQLGEAAAAYRLGKFNHASRAYSGALLSTRKTVQEHAHYGLGNTHFYQGLRILESGESGQPPDPKSIEATILYWRDALGHFDGALELDPGNTKARQNRERVQQRLDELLEEQRRQEQQRESQQPSHDPEQKPEEKPEDREEPGQNGEPSDPGQSPKNGQPDQPGDPDQTPPDQPGRPPGEQEDAPEAARIALSPRPGESPEEYARRVLNENADFQDRPVPFRFRNLPRPEKDW